MGGISMMVMNSVSATVSPVTSGLELYYDPANSASYPGTGTTLFDLSPSGVNATLAGSPTDSGNYFTFTGSQSILTGNLYGLFSGWQHSLEIWVYPTAISCAFSDLGVPNFSGYHSTGLEFYSAGPFTLSNAMLWNGTAVTRVGGGTTPLNNWYQIVRVYNGSNTAYAYVNKTQSATTSITWDVPYSGGAGRTGWYLSFGSGDATFFATGAAFQGRIGVIRLYNRVLTADEVTQNYNATKALYGL